MPFKSLRTASATPGSLGIPTPLRFSCFLPKKEAHESAAPAASALVYTFILCGVLLLVPSSSSQVLMLLSTKMLWNSAFFTPLTCNAFILGFFRFRVGSTASLHTAIYHTPLFFSASENSRENIPTSTAPLMQSVKPLPAPPA